MMDVTASVRQRLLNKARRSNRPFDELLQYYAMERFLYRFSLSEHRDRFILKGALMLMVWELDPPRTTKDMDLLGRTDSSVDAIIDLVKDVCRLDAEPDGLEFNAESVVAERIAEQNTYKGVRVLFDGFLGRAKRRMRLDVGFGDAVVPAPVEISYPTLLGLPAPRLRGYTRESSIAEKLETMVKLGEINSRMKDFYDVWMISRSFDFDGVVLFNAVRETFERRGTTVAGSPTALQDTFAKSSEKQTMWKAFVARQELPEAQVSFAPVVSSIREFVGPVLDNVANDVPFQKNWIAPGPWQ